VGLLAITDVGGEISFDIPPLGIAAAVLYFILGYFFFGTLMAALGAVTTSQREAGQVTFLVVLPGVAPLWFITPIIENPDGMLARVLSYVPFTAPVTSLARLGASGMGVIEVILSLLVLTASVGVVMWLTTRLFRAYLLMFGQRPGIVQILKTLRSA
jgi:ABC-2 type transport system permease protein